MSIENQYLELLQDILDNGVEKSDRTGTGTISVFGRQIRHKMSDGYPLLTTKKMAFKSMVTELLWFLRGDTNIKYLVDNGCNIWNGDAYKAYEYYHTNHPTIHSNRFDILNKEEFIDKIKTDDEFAKKWGELGPIYGRQWRSWNTINWEATDKIDPFDPDWPMLKWTIGGIDQIQNLIEQLKTNPDSRRLMVSAWNVGELDQMVLPPCHYGFQVYTRKLSLKEQLNVVSTIIGEEKIRTHKDNLERVDELNIPTRAISLMFNMRSTDVPLGLPFNIASYALLLEIIGKIVNMVPDELIANLGDTHIYKNQIDGVKEQLSRTPMKLPTIEISDEVKFNGTIDDFLESCNKDSFKLDGYESHPSIKIPLSN